MEAENPEPTAPAAPPPPPTPPHVPAGPTGGWPEDRGALTSAPPAPPELLDRVIPLGGPNPWQTAGWVAVIIAALVLRLTHLNTLALNPNEAPWAYEGWALFRGQPLVTGEPLPNAGAFLLLLQGALFFLFGATDVTARLAAAAPGLLLVLAPLLFRRWVGGPAALGMAAVIAISPTLAYASRVITPDIIIAACAVLALAALVSLGQGGPRPLPAACLGMVCAVALATGPAAISVAITLAIGLAAATLTDPAGTLAAGLRALRQPRIGYWAVVSLALTAVALFTRLLSYPRGIAGVWETLGAWRDLLTGPGSGQPVALFLLVLIIYELLAILFALVGLTSDRGNHIGATALCAAWGLAAFCLWSFSEGRLPEHAVHVVLPVALLAGIGLGETFHAIQWGTVWRGPSGLLALAMLGLLIAGAGTSVLFAQRAQYADPNDGIKPAIAVLCLVVVPLLYVIWRIGSAQFAQPATRSQPLLIALFVLAVFLGAFSYRSANLLAFERTDSGLEILAQQTSTEGTLPSVQRLLRLARDIGVNQGTAEDPTGSHTMSIEIERDLAWPYVWYFREFPALSLVEPGAAGRGAAQAVIAADGATLTANGYRVSAWPWRTQTPTEYLEPNMSDLFGYVVNPGKWADFWRFLLFRRGLAAPPPVVVSLGLQPELAARVETPTGPFALGQSPGSGTESGQFRDPVGVAVAPDGTILVVDSGNTRVQRFRSDGAFLDSWGGSSNVGLFTRTDNGLGPTGITLGPDGVAWVADTWGHRVVALAPTGQVVRTIGSGVVDLQNDPTRVGESPGSFFGPRAIAISDDAIYIVDTGNERVQKFTPDGAFELAWGGYGTEPDHLIEPVGIAIGPDGNVYVADSGNARIAIFTPDGEPVAQWPVADWPAPVIGGTPPSFQPYLAFDAAGNLYASASNAGEILQLGPDGEILNRILTAGGEKLAQPIGVAVDPNGNLLITDAGRDGVFTATPPPTAPPRSGPATPVG